MKRKMIDGESAFVGRVMRCPMCGHWIVKASGLFGRLIMVDGECECGCCGTKVIFGDQERLNKMAEDAEAETACVHDTEFEAVQRGRKQQKEDDEIVIASMRKKILALESALRRKTEELNAVKTCDNCKHRANLTTPSKTGFCLGCYMCGGHNLPDKWEADDGEEEG